MFEEAFEEEVRRYCNAIRRKVKQRDVLPSFYINSHADPIQEL